MSSDLNARRIVVAVVSLITGVVGTWLTLALIGTNFEEFGLEAIFVIISIAIAALIWLDYFLNTNIVPD